MSCKGHFKKLHDVMVELIASLDPESAQAFTEALNKKLEELRNEQATNLQEDTGASRQG